MGNVHLAASATSSRHATAMKYVSDQLPMCLTKGATDGIVVVSVSAERMSARPLLYTLLALQTSPWQRLPALCSTAMSLVIS